MRIYHALAVLPFLIWPASCFSPSPALLRLRAPLTRSPSTSSYSKPKAKQKPQLEQSSSIDPEIADTRFRIAKEFEKVDPTLSASLFAVTTITLLAAGFTTNTEIEDSISTFSPTETFLNILDTALPASSADVVALAVGEASAGLIAASALFLARFLGGRIPLNKSTDPSNPQTEETLSSAEYFLTSSFLTPVFSSLGISSILAVLVSSIPSSLVKQQSKSEGRKGDEKFGSSDVVEVATDITKWLEYSVLTKNYRGLISTFVSPLGYYSSWSARFIESFIFGVVCAASTELYKDTVYFYSEIDESKTSEVRSREVKKWIEGYLKTSISTGMLFGVYDSVRLPLSRLAIQLFSSSLDSCIGSSNLELCKNVYLLDNNDVEVGASLQGELRAIIISGYNILSRGGIFLDVDTDDAMAAGRGFIVGLISYFSNFGTHL
ncbi:hypothetical protein TrVE_jg5080 [Triparma verrucosa]|uniref:Uncharacterized protein n=1 Tax=Triparma verrucosa TaxID=1606542 RepID=A0A9W7B5R2_9STRA|nr:hypothetical protein TrVE_jg5080 [Triparma verrucosa]